jgi:error-prone DNA polymerase
VNYAELHAKTNFSFLEGASHPDELVRRAAELGYAALAVTDRNSLAGVVRAHGVAKEVGLKLLIGAEITPDDAQPAVLLATDRAAYGRLARLITCGRRRADKGACRLTFDDIARHADGLLAGVIARGPLSLWERARVRAVRQEESGHLEEDGHWQCDPLGPHPQPLSQRERGDTLLARYRELFGDRCYLLAELHHGPDDRRTLAQLVDLSQRVGVPLAASGDVHYHVPERQALGDVLTAIRCHCTVATAGELLFPNAQRYLRSPAEIAALFDDVPDAVARTLEIARRCTFSLDELRYEYPKELSPPGETPGEYLARLAWEGARARYPQGVPESVRRLLEHELQLIAELRYEAYFLTVWDLVRFARGRGILCQGRGSAANSAVCYCLGITAVDPERMDVLFERFISRERNEAPDIDVDFEHQRREEVIQYIYEKYGRDRAGMTAEVITYRPRSAIRDVGKALGLPLEQIDRPNQLARFWEEGDCLAPASTPGKCGDCAALIGPGEDAGAKHDAPDITQRRQLVELVDELVGFPRHLSQHTGGMVMTQGPLCELVPIENSAMPDRTVIEWNKDDLDELGILKVDCLALGMLSAICRCFELVWRHHGRELTLANIPEGDEDVFAMIRRADTVGVFQIESRAQMNMLPRLRPRCFYDLVIEVAIVRPGPIQGNMVHPYLRRRNGEEPVSYPNEAIRRVLEKTLGVPLFQEQAMRLAVVAAGFTPGEADQLRRAMGAWRRPGVIEQFRKRLIAGMKATGLTGEYAESVFNQIRGFGDYGFPESHAASFALLVYVSAWLKHHYPAALTAAILNSQPMGFYAPAQLVRSAREHGVEVRPADVNFSEGECTLEAAENLPSPIGSGVGGEGRIAESPSHDGFPTSALTLTLSQRERGQAGTLSQRERGPAVRLGLDLLYGVATRDIERIVQARKAGPFRSIDEFVRRTGLQQASVVRLAKAGAFGSLDLVRRESLWDALAYDPKPLPLFEQEGGLSQLSHERKWDCPLPCAATPSLPAMSLADEVLADYRAMGLSLRAHPVTFLRDELNSLGVTPAADLKTCPNGKPVRVAGIVLVRQRPSAAKGITFVTLEDETGTVNLIVRPAVWRRCRAAALDATFLLAHGRLQRQAGVIHVLAGKLEDISKRWRGIGSQSRDFC